MGPPQNFHGKTGFFLPLIGWWATQAHFPPVQQFAYATYLWTCTQPVYLQTIHVISCINRRPSAASWLGLELGEFSRNAVKTCQTCRKRRGQSEVAARLTWTQRPEKINRLRNFKRNVCVGHLKHKSLCTKVFFFKQRIFRGSRSGGTHLIQLIGLNICQPDEVLELLGAHSSQSNKL